MRQIAGHHLLPWFAHPRGAVPTNGQDFQYRYYKSSIERARELSLPVTFVTTQWESGLSRKPYMDLPPAENPDVVTADGKVQGRVSPFGPVAPWRRIGRQHTDEPWMKQIQQWYPNPPLVVFLSNNEHAKLNWTEADTDRRVSGEARAKAATDDFKHRVVADGWIERYRVLQDGMRGGLEKETWRKNSIYIGYDAFGPTQFGRWGGWPAYSQHSTGQIPPAPLMWDGSRYRATTPTIGISGRNFTVWSPQIEFMNLVFMQREAVRLNPQFWFEFSVWDGYQGGLLAKFHAAPSCGRPAGRPSPSVGQAPCSSGCGSHALCVVHNFRGWTEPWVDVMGENGSVTHGEGGPYFLAVMNAVDRVHANPALHQWWRRGNWCPTAPTHTRTRRRSRRNTDRRTAGFCWTPASTRRGPGAWAPSCRSSPWRWCKARPPTRQWLVYAHSPLKDCKAVGVTIPDYKAVTIDVPVAGAFYQVDEARGTAEQLQR